MFFNCRGEDVEKRSRNVVAETDVWEGMIFRWLENVLEKSPGEVWWLKNNFAMLTS